MQAAASLATEGGGALYELGKGWVSLRASERKTPEEMAAKFADDKQTTFVGRADREVVANLYKDLHKKVSAYDEARVRFVVRLADQIVSCMGIGCVTL